MQPFNHFIYGAVTAMLMINLGDYLVENVDGMLGFWLALGLTLTYAAVAIRVYERVYGSKRYYTIDEFFERLRGRRSNRRS